MNNRQDLFGIFVAIGVTAGAILIASNLSMMQNDSIGSQGQLIIERTTLEVKEIPEIVDEVAEETAETTEELLEESEAVEELADEVIPEVPKVIKQMEGKLIEQVSIPVGTGAPGCEETNSCYLPVDAEILPNGEVIWTNNDIVPHTVTSGNPRDGPNGLFDSGLINPEESYSLEFDIAFEYDYFCIVHPWMQGTIVVG